MTALIIDEKPAIDPMPALAIAIWVKRAGSVASSVFRFPTLRVTAAKAAEVASSAVSLILASLFATALTPYAVGRRDL
jgi:hypothetical protein